MNGPGNWAGNIRYGCSAIHYPRSVEEAARIVAANRKVRGLGTRHTFNAIAASEGALVSLKHLDRVTRIEPGTDQPTVTVEAGCRYGDLARHLHGEGLALRNMASLPHISVAGAVATGTHGSGDQNPGLAADVVAFTFIRADGTLATLRRGDADFAGAVVGLGALGLVVELVLEVQPTFDMTQEVFERLPLKELDAHFDAITGAAYSVSLFRDWQTDAINQVWLKRRIRSSEVLDWAPEFFGARRLVQRRHPVEGISADNCTEQRRLPGPWHERLPHFRMDFQPSIGDELHSEYFVPRAVVREAMRAVGALAPEFAGRLWIAEVRTILRDELWLSPFYERDAVALHFTWRNNPQWVEGFLPTLEARLAPFRARPHWGKMFALKRAGLQPLYPRFDDFRALVRRHDPEGKFWNPFLQERIG
jgi:xylitol oxidase